MASPLYEMPPERDQSLTLSLKGGQNETNIYFFNGDDGNVVFSIQYQLGNC